MGRFSVPEGKNQHVIFPQLVHHSVISSAKFPIFFESLPKRRSVLVGLKSQTRFNSVSNPTAKVTRDVRDIFLTDGRVAVEGERHSSPRTFRGAPHLRMSLCGLLIKCCHPPFSNVYQRPIFINIDGNIQLRSLSEELASNRA